ncbi:NAD-P-binding protein [Trametes meyenii]|nr:NAD-P-binding protein [Trametes meyenii]
MSGSQPSATNGQAAASESTPPAAAAGPVSAPAQTSGTARTSSSPKLRFGILGAARIAPDALLKPARSHDDVAVVAVACRDEERGARYARKHGIPKVYAGARAYHDLVADPEIDVVYNPLPNGLHFEWTMRALHAGKHVLLEKPTTSTAEEARQIFALAEQKKLVVLEAMHSTFHPAMQRVREIVQSGELGKVKSVRVHFGLPSVVSRFLFPDDDVRFKYDLAGGCTMDMGVYSVAVTRYVTGTEHTAVEVTSAESTGHPLDPARIDRAMHATYALPDSVTAETTTDWAIPGWGPFGIIPSAIKLTASVSLEGGDVDFYNFVLPTAYHSIKVRPKRGAARTERVYRYADGRGEKSWSTYRYQLEAFVDKVRGRTPWAWIDAETTVTEMEILERVYAKAGLPPRVSPPFQLEGDSGVATA